MVFALWIGLDRIIYLISIIYLVYRKIVDAMKSLDVYYLMMAEQLLAVLVVSSSKLLSRSKMERQR